MIPILVSPGSASLHPLATHFPLVLLLVAPLLILTGALLPPRRGHRLLLAAFLLIALGTAGVFIAVPTGEAAAKATVLNGGAHAVLLVHESLGLETRLIFALFFVLYLGIILIPRILHQRESRLFSTVLPLAFLILYCSGVLLLVNTAHEGGRLVDEFGVRAMPASANVTHASH